MIALATGKSLNSFVAEALARRVQEELPEKQLPQKKRRAG
jgi:hypothetical protein